MKNIFVYITCSSEQEAKKIARHLLNLKLIACANFFQVNSMYIWKEKINEGKESAMILKTFDNNFNQIKEEVANIHSYGTPCVAKIPIEINEPYAKWVSNVLNSGTKT